MMLKRVMGKASFATLQDMSGRIQVYVSNDDVTGNEAHEAFKHWDLGDIVGVDGHAVQDEHGRADGPAPRAIRLLAKSLRPLPEKFHGLTDQEQRYRQRYVDLHRERGARARLRDALAASCRRCASSWWRAATSRSRRR